MKEQLAPIINEEVSKAVQYKCDEIIPSLKSTWNAIQSQKVWEHEHSIVVFGFNITKPPMEAASDLLKNNLKIMTQSV